MEGRHAAFLPHREFVMEFLFFVVILFVCNALEVADGQCITSSLSKFTVQEFNSTTNSPKGPSTGCFHSGNRTYVLSLETARAIRSLDVANGSLISTKFRYSYNASIWFNYLGNATTQSVYTVEFDPPIFLKHLVVSIGLFKDGLQCMNLTINACNEDIVPEVSFETGDSEFYEAINVTCNITGQPYAEVTWQTTDGFVFPMKYIDNFISGDSTFHSSTLKLSKEALAEDGFKCNLRSPPCMRVICMARYPGATRDSKIQKNLDVFPSPQENLYIKMVRPTSVLLNWKKPFKDYIMNYTKFQFGLSGTQRPTWDEVSANDMDTKIFHYSIEYLRPCTFYKLEMAAINYQGRSSLIESNFTTTTGLISMSFKVQNITQSSFIAFWTIEEQVGRDCVNDTTTGFLINYRCVQGSDLSSCHRWQQLNASVDARHAKLDYLHPATHYEVYVTALTTNSEFNMTTRVISLVTHNALPSAAPLNLKLFTINTTSIELSWEDIIKESQHGEILYYKLSVYETATLHFILNISTAMINSTIVTGLQKCTEYSFEVTGCNSVGCGPVVNKATKTADEIFTALSSVDFYLNEIDPKNISVTVAAVGNFSSEKCVTGYVVQYRERSAVNWTVTRKVSINENSTVFDLRPFTTYVLRARLVGVSSFGNWTDMIMLETSEGIPSAVKNLTFVESSFNELEVDWDSPLHPNGIIQNYVMEITGLRSYNSSFFELYRFDLANQTQRKIERLSPATLYNISVYARNSKYTGLKIAFAYITQALPPLQPPPVILDEATSIFANIMLTAVAVAAVNGPITCYEVIVEQQEGNWEYLNFSKAIPSYDEALSRNLSFYVAKKIPPFTGMINFFIGDGNIESGLRNPPLHQRRNYTIHIRARTEWDGKTLYSTPSATQLIRYPVHQKPVSASDRKTPYSITIRLPKFDEKTKYSRIIIMKVDPKGIIGIPHPDNYKDSNITVYSISQTKQFTLPYVTAELGRNYFETVDTFVIGDGQQTNRSTMRKRRNVSNGSITTFFNGPLDPGSSYIMFYRAYHTEAVYFSSDWSNQITTENLPLKEKAPKGSEAGLIVGIIICIVAVPFFIVVGYIIWRRNRKSFEANYRFSTMELVAKDKKTHNITFSEGSFDPDSSSGSSNNAPPHDLIYETDPAHAPISISEFSDYYDTMKEKDYGFEDEFNELDDSSSKQRQEAKKKVNTALNRNAEAVPLDFARVVLSRDAKGASDYINAAYIDSYNMRHAYIATQAPMKETIEDFWDMISQQNVRTIVMLSHILDDDRLNPSDYWPTSSLVFRNHELTVESKDTVFEDHAVIRTFALSGKKTALRIVRLFQFNKWPERGVPSSIKDLLRFRDQVNKWRKGETSPQVIHCNNGSGRTGTYIALDAILNNIGTSKTVDIFNYVNYLRTRRTNMVENDRQYEFIWEVVNELLNKVDRDTAMTKQNAKELFCSLAAVDPVTGCTGFQKLFRRLTRGLKTESSLLKNLEGSKAINEYKNRYSFKMPHDSFRVRLPVFGSAKSTASDYINATLVSLSDSSRFITTQAPFGVTANDFWTMMYFSRAEIIVSLNDLEEGNVSFTRYWPETQESCATFGDFKVTLESETTPFQCVIQRDFILSKVSDSEETKEVTQFHMLGWEDHDIPSSRVAVLLLCHQLLSQGLSEDKPPLVVQCSDGFGRSGTFCVCLETIKRLTDYGIADISSIARKFKERNKFFIENETQFKFIFEIALDFVLRR